MGDEVSAERGLKRVSWPIPLVARSGTIQVILLKSSNCRKASNSTADGWVLGVHSFRVF